MYCRQQGQAVFRPQQRHTFALEALLRWYRSGADVQVKLPLLATYGPRVNRLELGAPILLGTLRNIRNERAQLRTPRSQKGRRCGALARSTTYAQSRKWRRLERVEFSGQTR